MEILPDRCTMIAKKELIYAGTVGLICWLGGIVFINRKKTSDAKSVMADAAKTMLDDQVTCLPSSLTYFFFIIIIISIHALCCFSAPTDLRPRRPSRSDCGCSLRERGTREGISCPSKRERSTWQCRRRSGLNFFLSLRRHILERNTLKNPAEPQPPRVYAHSGHTGVLATLPGSGRPRDSTPTPPPPTPNHTAVTPCAESTDSGRRLLARNA